MFILILGITACLLLFPSFSRLSIFSGGEFAFPESIGLIFAYLTLLSTFLFYIFPKLFIKIKKRLYKYLIFIGTIGFSLFTLLIVITFVWIRHDVTTNCLEATIKYGGNCTAALINLLEDDNQNFRSKNSAVWTLGQLADDRALPILFKLSTGNIPTREPYNNTLSQYELKKAIKWCQQGNWTSWMY